MGRIALVLAVCAFAGCYNPRFPSETPGAEPLPRETGNSQETSARQNRRDSAAGSGASVRTE
ncbi:MAG TPA: hypothetical protein VIV54_06550 [Burkholderiales bacterium]